MAFAVVEDAPALPSFAEVVELVVAVVGSSMTRVMILSLSIDGEKAPALAEIPGEQLRVIVSTYPFWPSRACWGLRLRMRVASDVGGEMAHVQTHWGSTQTVSGLAIEYYPRVVRLYRNM